MTLDRMTPAAFSSEVTEEEIEAVVAEAVAALVDAAPGTLDTLNELAAALGDDPNFATTMTNLLAAKADAAATTSALAGKQPLAAELTALAAIAGTAYGRSVLAAATAADLAALVASVWRFKSGLYYAAPSASTSTALHSQGFAFASPFPVGQTTAFDRIGASIVTTPGEAGAKVRLGIYADTGTGYPGALIVDAGQIAADALGDFELTIAQTLKPGLYWPTAVAQSCPTTGPTMRVNGPTQFMVGSTLANTLAGIARNAYRQISGMTGALPANFIGTVDAQGGATRIALRAA